MQEPTLICGECGAKAFTVVKPSGWRWFSLSRHWVCAACADAGGRPLADTEGRAESTDLQALAAEVPKGDE